MNTWPSSIRLPGWAEKPEDIALISGGRLIFFANLESRKRLPGGKKQKVASRRIIHFR